MLALSHWKTALFMILLAGALGGCVERTVPAPVASLQAPPPQTAPAQEVPPVAAAPIDEAPAAPPAPPPLIAALAGKTDVALLLPLSGGNAALGEDMEDAAAMALVDIGGETLAITPKNTHGYPDGAVDAANQAIAEGAKLILGPLTAPEIEAVRPVAEQANLNVIAFSNQARVAGGRVFILGFDPEREIKRVVVQARTAGLDRFAIVAPSTAYGRLAASAARDALRTSGARLDLVSFYAPGNPANALHGVQTDKAGAPGALVIAEPDTAMLHRLAQDLGSAGIDAAKTRILGVGGWETADAETVTALGGAWFPGPSPDPVAAFEQRFRAAYGRRPLRLASLAYEAVIIAAALEHTPDPGFSSDALTAAGGFTGPNGIFRLLPDGTAERGLAVLQLGSGGPTLVSPAPESFAGTGQ